MSNKFFQGGRNFFQGAFAPLRHLGYGPDLLYPLS